MTRSPAFPFDGREPSTPALWRTSLGPYWLRRLSFTVLRSYVGCPVDGRVAFGYSPTLLEMKRHGNAAGRRQVGRYVAQAWVGVPDGYAANRREDGDGNGHTEAQGRQGTSGKLGIGSSHE